METIGAIPLTLSYKEHDYVTAAISHLPHVIAASLVNLVKSCDSKDGVMKMIAAGGFKDITRIASSSPEMWQQICLTNAENISSLLRTYIQSLNELADYIDDHNRELAEGALRIEFYSQDTLSHAMEIMTEHGYKIHTR